jgi:hypothetical protein
VQLSDIEGARMQIVGIPGDEPTIGIEPDNVRALKVLVTVPADQRDKLTGSSTPFRFAIVDAADGSILYHDATFRGPEHE